MMAKVKKQCEDDIEKKFANIIQQGLSKHFAGIKNPTEQQTIAWKSLLLEGRDTFAIVPTGHGKSLIHQAATDIAQELSIGGHKRW